jgi:hypothetical protein
MWSHEQLATTSMGAGSDLTQYCLQGLGHRPLDKSQKICLQGMRNQYPRKMSVVAEWVTHHSLFVLWLS